MADDEEYNYDDNVNEDDVSKLKNKINAAESENINLNNALNSSQQEKKDSNFLHIQISNQDMLEKLEHFYRGETWAMNDEGEQDWVKPENTDLITFNDFGVGSLMEIITKYIDKNTTLSYYPEERIYEILGDIGDDLVLLMLCNYKKMGMDTQFKKSKFRVTITTTLHLIESAYRRALRGKTMEEINQSRVVSQFSAPTQQPSQQPVKRGGISRLFGNR